MPNYKPAQDDDRRRVVEQIDLIRAEQGDENVAWDTDDPADFTYLYDPKHLLARSDDLPRVDDAVDILNATDAYLGDVTVEEFPPDGSGRAPLDLVRLVLPGRRDGNPRQVQLALEELDDKGANDGEPMVSPDHWMHFAGIGNTRLCPAIEPEESGLAEPWPAVVADTSRGTDVLVCVVDSGWHPPFGQQGASTTWLRGVEGDDEQIPSAATGGPGLRPYSGHGAFIAGVVRCLAPGADVYVERFIGGTGSMRESDMVRQLRQSLNREPQIINLSAGAITREDRPLLSFERFWQQDLKDIEGCLLVAAAGNDATSAPFWPAAFEWALGVGSLDRDGSISSFSNYGESADIYALGRNIVNAYPNGTYVCRETPDKDDVRVFGTGMARWSGTSFAAPVVAALIASRIPAGGNSRAVRDTLLAGGADGTVTDPDQAAVPAMFPPYL
jgi:subtilisin family serine protease